MWQEKLPLDGRAIYRPIPIEEAAYIAGFFDGEGSVVIVEHNKPGTPAGHDRRTPHLRLHIQITNRDIAVLKWMQERCGGTIHSKIRGHERWARAFELHISNRRECDRFFRAILPYLHIKRRHADIALAFLALGLSRTTFTARGKTWPYRQQHPDDLAARRALRAQLKVLNGKGLAYAG